MIMRLAPVTVLLQGPVQHEGEPVPLFHAAKLGKIFKPAYIVSIRKKPT